MGDYKFRRSSKWEQHICNRSIDIERSILGCVNCKCWRMLWHIRNIAYQSVLGNQTNDPLVCSTVDRKSFPFIRKKIIEKLFCHVFFSVELSTCYLGAECLLFIPSWVAEWICRRWISCCDSNICERNCIRQVNNSFRYKTWQTCMITVFSLI